MNEKIGVLFGIHGDPPHLGHLNVVLELKKHLGHGVTFFVMPAGAHPFLKVEHASKEHRLEMTRLLFADVPHVIVSDYEIKKEGICYTVDTLRHLKNKNPTLKLYFVMAQDVANHFFSWKNPEDILSIATPIIVPRIGHSLQDGLIDQFKPVIPEILMIKTLDISSTSVRAQLKKERFSKDLSGPVLSYILEQDLYT